MPVLVQDPIPVELENLLERRRRLGLDRRDEVWEGVLHMAPAPRKRHGLTIAQLIGLLLPLAADAGLEVVDSFNIGEPDNFRIPDAGLLRPGPDAVYLETAALAVEILSPGDDTWDKLPFYADHHVEELLIVDPQTHKVDWLALTDGEYKPIERSGLIDLGATQLAAQIDWPPAGD